MFNSQQVFQSKIDIKQNGSSLQDFPVTLNIMSQSITWKPVFWDSETDVALSGAKRSNIRGYDVEITLDYDRMLEPDKLKTILDGLVYAKASNVEVTFYPDASVNDESFNVLPSGDTSRLHEYEDTVKKGESPTLVFENDAVINQIDTSSANGGGSAGDADTLDGLESSQFLRSDVDDTFTGGNMEFQSTVGITDNLNMYSNRIQSVANPVNGGDAVNKGYLFPDGDNQALGEGDSVTFSDASLGNLTNGRIVFTGSNGLLQDSTDLTFDGSGLGVDRPSTFGDVATFNSGVNLNDVANVGSDVLLDDADTDISTNTFASGFAGTGLGFLNDGTWDGTMDNLTVRQRMRVYELLISQIRATNGSIVASSAGEVALPTSDLQNPVSGVGGNLDWTSTDPFWTESNQFWFDTYRIYVEENKFVPFVEGDLVIAQRFNGAGTYLVEGTVVNVENGSSTVTNNSTRRYYDIALEEGSDLPESGMEFVRWGNLSDPDRQGLLYMTGDDDGAPYMDIVYGLDSHDKRNTQGTIKGRIGRLDGIVDTDFPTLDGNQTNEFGVYIDGGYFNNVEVRGTITILDTDASNSATKQYVHDQVSAGSGEGMQIIRSDSEPDDRIGGEPLVTGDMWIDTSDGDKPYTYDGSQFVRAYTIIDGGDLITGSVVADKISIGSVKDIDSDATVASDLGDVADLNEISSTYIANGAVITSKIATGAITADKIESNTITASEIASNTITATELSANSVTADEIDVTNLNAVNANTGDLNVDGRLEMSGTGVITNSNDDFKIDANGYRVSPSSTFQPERAYVIGDDTTDQGYLYGNATNGIVLESPQSDLFLVAEEDISLQADGSNASSVITLDDSGIIQLSPERKVRVNFGTIKIPSFTTTERDNLSNVEAGEMIWNTTDGQAQIWSSQHGNWRGMTNA